ncbi:hypothetical protein PIB30_035406 [Stylosanthes scabra]|uniref:Uncharacterized protein n=1 Tax=Stylosanthes scabra TaxID=79078 RepID=A0ABU6QCT5_9FABA|nr:hypothetical protein [Stylosanthes scabra]
MDDSGRGFLSFRAHGKMKIFDFSDESSSFKEMYFKVSGATKTQPFFLDSEKKSRFHLYWRMGYRSPQPGANELSEEERNAASLLQMVWGKEHLPIKNLMCDDETAKKVAVDMAGGLATLVAMRRKLIAKKQSEGDKGPSPSATVDLTEETTVATEQVEPDKSEGHVSSPEDIPEHSLSEKRRRVQKEAVEESSNFLNLLERGFDPIPFVDQYLMTSETEKALGDLEADDKLVLVQRMLLQVIIHCQDVQRENAGAPSLRSLLSEKEKSNKFLSSRVADLETKIKSRDAEILRLEGVERTLGDKARKFEDEKRALEEGKRGTEKVTELLASLKKAQEDLASMEKMKEEAEALAVNGVTEIEENVLEQVRLLALEIDFSKVSAYNKVVDGQIVEFPVNELPEVPIPEVLK